MADRGQAAACAAAYAACPALRGVRPAVEHKGQRRVFVFAAVPDTAGGHGPRQVVRVTVDAAGQVVRVSMAR
jgi:hypothetical protein